MENPNTTSINNHESLDFSSEQKYLTDFDQPSTLHNTTQEKIKGDTHLQYAAKYQKSFTDSHGPSSMAVNSNTQSFYNSDYQIKFQECLYTETGELNEDFKQNLKIFHSVFSVLFILKFFCILIGFVMYSTAVNYFCINLTVIFLISVIQGGVFFYVWKYCTAKERVNNFYMILVMLSIFYFGIMNPRIMSPLLGLEGLEKIEPDSSLFILALNVITRDLFYNNPIMTLVQCLAGVLISLIMYFIEVNSNNFDTLSNLILLSICSVYLIIYCFRIDSKQKHFFTEYDPQKNIAQKIESVCKVNHKENLTQREILLNKCNMLGSIFQYIQPLMVNKSMSKKIDEASKELFEIKNFIINLPLISTNQVSIMLQEIDSKISDLPIFDESLENQIKVRSFSYEPNKKGYFYQNFRWNWDFNVFKANEQDLFCVSSQYAIDLTIENNELKWLNHNKFFRFLGELEGKYLNNFYHNSLHAVDVLHSMIYLLFSCNLNSKLKALDWITCIVAALGHDVGHQGMDNLYLKETNNDLTVLYNDHMALENMHCAEIFQLILKDEYNFAQSIGRSNWKVFRENLIDLVLGTDFSTYRETAGKLNCFVSENLAEDCFLLKGKPFILSIVLKCADVGHFGKELELYDTWSKLLLSEYMELSNQDCSNFILRKEEEFFTSNSKFINQHVLPLYQSFEAYISPHNHTIENILKNLKENKKVCFINNSPVGSTTENAAAFWVKEGFFK